MKKVDFTPAQLAAVDIGRRHLRHLRGGGARLGQDHRAGGVFPAAGGGGRGSAAHPGHHLHRKGRRQHAGQAGASVSRRPRFAPSWSAPGSRRCTASARGCCARTPCSRAIDPEFSVADERESWRMQQECHGRGPGRAVSTNSPAAVRALIRGLSSPEFEEARAFGLRRHARRRRAGGRSGRLSPSRRAPRTARYRLTLRRTPGSEPADDLEHRAEPAPGRDPRKRGAHRDARAARSKRCGPSRRFRPICKSARAAPRPTSWCERCKERSRAS